MKWLWWVGVVLVLVDAGLAPVLGMETDIWWHLAAGRRFWEHGLELTDPFSFTHPQEAWIRIDWAFGLLLYPLYAALGLPGLIALRALALVGAAAALGWTLRARTMGERVLLVLLTASIWSQSVGLRPATASIVFTSLWVLVLEQARQGNSRWLRLLPPILVVWFNLHVASLAGCLLLGLYFVGQALQARAQGQALAREWWWVPPLCALALFLNPQPWQAVYYPIHFLLVRSPWRDVILEVQTPGWDWPGTWQTRVLLVLAVVGAWRRWRQGEWTPALVTVVCGYLVAHTYRHQFQLCVALVPWAWLPPLRRAEVPLAVLLGLLSLRSALSLVEVRWPLSELVRRETFAERVLELTAQGPQGLRLFTDMNGAGYYLWRCDGRQKVFLDSRGDQVYVHPHIVEDYFEILLGGPRALELLDSYGVQAVANNRITSSGSALFDKVLPSSSGWVRVYADLTGELYCRKELAGAFPALPAPAYLQSYLDGFQAERSGQLVQAQQDWARSLQEYPRFSSAHQSLARLWTRQGRFEEARSALARAELCNPDAPGLVEDWSNLGRNWPAWIRWYLLPFWAL